MSLCMLVRDFGKLLDGFFLKRFLGIQFLYKRSVLNTVSMMF